MEFCEIGFDDWLGPATTPCPHMNPPASKATAPDPATDST